MGNETWEEARMHIMGKLSEHTSQLTSISTELNTFKTSFQVGMTELKTKIMIAAGIINLIVGSIVAYVMSKVLG
jgi:hypothetical protein